MTYDKGKVERFIHYLRHSFYYPLAGRLKPLGLEVDSDIANANVLSWLNQVANHRVHATTGQSPFGRLEHEQPYLQPMARPYPGVVAQAIESTDTERSQYEHPQAVQIIQHPLSIYDQLLNTSEVHYGHHA